MSSLEDEDHVYFFFRETAVEYINCGKVIFLQELKKDETLLNMYLNIQANIFFWNANSYFSPWKMIDSHLAKKPQSFRTAESEELLKSSSSKCKGSAERRRRSLKWNALFTTLWKLQKFPNLYFEWMEKEEKKMELG